MSLNPITAKICGAVLFFGLLLPLHATESYLVQQSGGQHVQTEDLNLFTHVAHIPATSDVSTIRFENITPVMLPTTVTYTRDGSYCDELVFREPGGSAYCPSEHSGSPLAAYRATYSFRGSPMVSDETGQTRFEFHVYFRPEELPASLKSMLSTRNQNKAETASYFSVKTYRESVERVAVSQSNVCNDAIIDGTWTQSNSKCVQDLVDKRVLTPSSNISVRINPVAAQAAEKLAASR